MVAAYRASGPCDRPAGWVEMLRSTVRTEFQVERYRPPSDDPVLRPPACKVTACTALAADRGVWCPRHRAQATTANIDLALFVSTAESSVARYRSGSLACLVASCSNGAGRSQLCRSHHLRWSSARRPDKTVWAATARPALPIPDCAVHGCGRPQDSNAGLCRAHLNDWTAAGRPAIGSFVATARELRDAVPTFDLTGLHASVRLEVQYVLQARRDAGTARLTPGGIAPFVSLLRMEPLLTSILERSLSDWEHDIAALPWTGRAGHPPAFARYAYDVLALKATTPARPYEADVWDLRQLGLKNQNGPRTVRFDDIAVEWIRDTAKLWARHRLARVAATTVVGNIIHIRAFAAFLKAAHPDKTEPSQLHRTVIEDYLASIARPSDQAPQARPSRRWPCSSKTAEFMNGSCSPTAHVCFGRISHASIARSRKRSTNTSWTSSKPTRHSTC